MDIVISREDRRLMRRRGAGAREMKDTQFGFVVEGCLNEGIPFGSTEVEDRGREVTTCLKLSGASPSTKLTATARTSKKRKAPDDLRHDASENEKGTIEAKRKRSRTVQQVKDTTNESDCLPTEKKPIARTQKGAHKKEKLQTSPSSDSMTNLKPLGLGQKRVSGQTSTARKQCTRLKGEDNAVQKDDRRTSRDQNDKSALDCQPAPVRKRGRPKKGVGLEAMCQPGTTKLGTRLAQGGCNERKSTTRLEIFEESTKPHSSPMHEEKALDKSRSQLNDSPTSSRAECSKARMHRSNMDGASPSDKVRIWEDSNSQIDEHTVTQNPASTQNKERRKQGPHGDTDHQDLRKSCIQSRVDSNLVGRLESIPLAETSPNINKTKQSGKRVLDELCERPDDLKKESSKDQLSRSLFKPKINVQQQKRRKLAFFEDDSDSSELQDYGEVRIPMALKSMGGLGGKWKF